MKPVLIKGPPVAAMLIKDTRVNAVLIEGTPVAALLIKNKPCASRSARVRKWPQVTLIR